MLNRSTLIALAIALALVVWVLSGLLFSDRGDPAEAVAETPVFAVTVRETVSRDFVQRITVRGRTEALRAVSLQAEVDGRVIEAPVERGDRVATGDLLCRIAPNDRTARLGEARALAEQRRIEYEAAEKLAEKEFRSATQLAQAKAQYEAAAAQVRQMEVALDATSIRAPFDGLVEDRPANVGDYLQPGGICARLIDEDPFLAVGEVSEEDVDALEIGREATVELVNGEERRGPIRFVSSTADERTRTFRVEVALANPDRALREGMSADIVVPVRETRAHYISPANLVLDASGRIGVRAVDSDDVVVFHPIEILSDDLGGIWVSGLPQRARIVTVGQDFVTEGQQVVARPETSDGEARG